MKAKPTRLYAGLQSSIQEAKGNDSETMMT